MLSVVVKLIYCDSIQEGMVFVSLSFPDLLPRTANYQMRNHSPLQESEDTEPLYFDSVNESRPLSRRRDSSAQRTVPPPISNSAARSYQHNNTRNPGTSAHHFSFDDPQGDSVPRSQTPTLPEPSDFSVTTSCNDPSSDEEEPYVNL